MKSTVKIIGTVGTCIAMVAALGLAGCGSASNSNSSNAPSQEAADPVEEGTGEWVFQDADGTYWAADTAISKDDRSITVWLPMDDPEEWSFSMACEGDSPLDLLEEPSVSDDGTTWSATFSGAAIDATGEVEITFTQKYVAGSQPDRRQFVMGVNVADDDSLTLLGTSGAGFPAEWYDLDETDCFGVRVPVGESGSWQFDANEEFLEVLAGPAEDGDEYAASYRAKQAGASVISVNKFDDEGNPVFNGVLNLWADESGMISVQSAEWFVSR